MKALIDTHDTGMIGPARQAGAALRTFYKISTAWNLSIQEQMDLLGIEARSTFFGLRKRAQESRDVTGVSKDMLERLSYLLGIYKALQILFPNSHFADEWIKQPNSAPLFGGKPALHRMLSGRVADLYIVRQYLDAERGGGAA